MDYETGERGERKAPIPNGRTTSPQRWNNVKKTSQHCINAEMTFCPCWIHVKSLTNFADISRCTDYTSPHIRAGIELTTLVVKSTIWLRNQSTSRHVSPVGAFILTHSVGKINIASESWTLYIIYLCSWHRSCHMYNIVLLNIITFIKSK